MMIYAIINNLKSTMTAVAITTLLTTNAVYAGDPPPEPPEYEVTVIPGPNCGIFGYEPAVGLGINDLGNICGFERDCSTDQEPFFWSPQTGRIVLEIPEGFGEGRAQDLNNANQIVGFLRLNVRPQAILWQDDQFIELGVPHGGDASDALSINSKSQVVGYWGNVVFGPSPLAFIWQDGVITDLTPDLGNPKSIAYDINDLGIVTGWMGTNQSNDAHAFIWDEGNVIDLGVIPGGFTGEGMAINNHGDVAVRGRMLNKNKEAIFRSFLWRDGQWIDIGVLPGFDETRAVDLNDAGEITGQCEMLDSTAARPFLWRDGTMWDINDLWSSDDSDLLFIGLPRSINQVGQIVTTSGLHNEFAGPAIRLSPILPIPGDLDGDGQVNTTDLLILLGSWGPCAVCADCPADLNDNCIVNTSDLLVLFSNWG